MFQFSIFFFWQLCAGRNHGDLKWLGQIKTSWIKKRFKKRLTAGFILAVISKEILFLNGAITFPLGHTHSLSCSIQIQIIPLIEQRRSRLNWKHCTVLKCEQHVHCSQVCWTDNERHQNVDSFHTDTLSVLRIKCCGQSSSHPQLSLMHRHGSCAVSALIFRLTVLRSQVCVAWQQYSERFDLSAGFRTAAFFFLLSFVPLKWTSHHIRVLASPEWAEQQRLVGEGSQKQTPYTHTHTYIHTHTHTQPGLSAADRQVHNFVTLFTY